MTLKPDLITALSALFSVSHSIHLACNKLQCLIKVYHRGKHTHTFCKEFTDKAGKHTEMLMWHPAEHNE